MKKRVFWLESIIRDRCPDVDLGEGPSIAITDDCDNPPSDIDNTGRLSGKIDGSPLQGEEQTADFNTEPLVSSQFQGQPTPRQTAITSYAQPERLAHEIGLVSLSAGTDPKYIGPSSGYFFAKLVLACASKHGQQPSRTQGRTIQDSGMHSAIDLARDVFQIPPTPLPSSLDHAVQLSMAYFETVHVQYPFLYQPAHMKLIEHVYEAANPSSIASFQVNMVLAIGATVLSRRVKIPFSGEGFCANAMKYFDRLCVENSLKGLQSLLLLTVYTLYSPSLGLNAWHLNYQCLASVLDLGLQRNITVSSKVTSLEQELRTRAFWVVYSLDRTLATIMGRPIGLRDEACELRVYPMPPLIQKIYSPTPAASDR